MHIRWWNSFTILAVILVAISVVGAIAGDRMVFDPGHVPTHREWLVYLAAGVLMLVNGLLPPGTVADDSNRQGEGKA